MVALAEIDKFKTLAESLRSGAASTVAVRADGAGVVRHLSASAVCSGEQGRATFTGYVADSETGLMYARARMYAPILGTFVNRDPWMERPLCFQNAKKYSENDLDEMWGGVSGGSISSQLALLADLGRSYGWKSDGGACGMQPRARDGYQDGFSLYRSYFVANRTDPFGLACGSGDVGDALIPDRPFGFDFTPCCEIHDRCYETCGMSKEACDDEFYQCMLEVVEGTGSSDFTKWWGRRLAGTYYRAVKWFGNGAYCGAQKKAGCCPLPDNCK